MQKLVVLIGLNTLAKAQLARDLSVYFQEQGYVTSQTDSALKPFADVYTQTPGKASEQIMIWATPENTEMERLVDILADVKWSGIEPLTIALLDTHTCDCFPRLREEMEATADLTLSMPFDTQEALWSISAQL
jgi:hypothetical protein